MNDRTTLRTPDGVALGIHDLPLAQLRRLLADPEDLLWRNLDRPVKISHTSLMVEAELQLSRGTVHVAYKR